MPAPIPLCAECGVRERGAFPPGREGEHLQLPGKLLAFRLAAPAWPPSDSSSARWARGWGQRASTAPLMTGAAGSSDPETHGSRARLPGPALETLGSAGNSEREWPSRVFCRIHFNTKKLKCMLIIFSYWNFISTPSNSSIKAVLLRPCIHTFAASGPAVPSPVPSEAQVFPRGTGNVCSGQPGPEEGAGGGRPESPGPKARAGTARGGASRPLHHGGRGSRPLLEEL